MAQTPKQAQSIGLVSGPSVQGLPQDAEQSAAAEALAQETAIQTAEKVGRTSHTEVQITLGDGQEVVCRTAKVGQIGLVLKFLREVAQKLEILSIEPSYLKARLLQIAEDPMSILTLMEEAEGFIWPLMSALTSLRGEPEVRNLEIDDALLISKTLWALNESFFSTRVLPLFLSSLKIKEPQPG